MKQCGECRYLDPDDIKDGKAFCKEKNERRFANDYCAENCDGFFRLGWGDTSRGKAAIAAADEYIKEHKPECFITTAIVNILGLSDDCEELNTLRIFRKEVLQKDTRYRELLLRYDTVGPVLARALAHDENSVQVAVDLYNIYIKGCVGYIKRGQIDNAVTLYVEMVERMVAKYMIRAEFVSDTVREMYVQDNGGHGVLKLQTM